MAASFHFFASLAMGTSLLLAPVSYGVAGRPLEAGVDSPAAPIQIDSTRQRDHARDAQAAFERTRVRYASRTHQAFSGPCDEWVGRMCIRISRGTEDGGWTPPPEDPRVEEARRELIATLEDVGRTIPGDPWVLGQRVAYLGEAGEWDGARSLARDCGLAEESNWWCLALEGTAAHFLGRFEEAERVFGQALAEMPEELRNEWRDLTPVVDARLQGLFRDAEGDSLAALEERLWALADPLFLVAGNDRRTEHYARHTLARIRSEARNPYGMRWGADLAEILVRYGPEVAFETQSAPQLHLGPTPVVGRFHPRSRGFLPEEKHFLDPAGIAPGDWTVDERGVRARHAPAYAPRIGTIEVEQVRFQRGDDLLLVLNWSLGEGEPEWAAGVAGKPVDAAADRTESEPGTADPQVGVFFFSLPELEPLDAGLRMGVPRSEALHAEDVHPGGVAIAELPEGRYLVSIEVLDGEGKRAWRSRYGVTHEPTPRGLVAMSDLLLLDPRAGAEPERVPEDGGITDPRSLREEAPDRLEAHLDRLVAADRLSGDIVEIAWEVYGLTGGEGTLSFRLSAAPTDRSLLRRAGELLRIVEPEPPVVVAWEEGIGPDQAIDAGAPLFRRMVMDLSSLPHGPIRLSLALYLPGRTEATVETVVQRIE